MNRSNRLLVLNVLAWAGCFASGEPLAFLGACLSISIYSLKDIL